MAHEALVIMGMLALLLLVCRLWPILLLVILGIFVAALRLLFLSAKKVEIIEPSSSPHLVNPTETEIQDMAYGRIQQRITELVLAEHPNARWVWQTGNARQSIMEGSPVYILLNGAGGYRRAQVLFQNLQVRGLAYQKQPSSDALQNDEQEEAAKKVSQVAQNCEYLAFEWVDAHAVELNARCNEAIARGETSLFLNETELPQPESWADICKELARNGMENCTCLPTGIQIRLA